MESTLALTRSMLKSRVGAFLGWGWGEEHDQPAWTADQELVLEDLIASGLRRFYFPEQPGRGFYDWSFLRPTSTQFLVTNITTINLPDDFGGIQGTITVAPAGTATGIQWWPVLTTNEAAVRLSYANFPDATGRPRQAAVMPLKGTQLNAGQRWALMVFPKPDQDYQIRFQYAILPDALTANTPLPYGGAQHAETILESCLAVAEERQDDTKSVHADSYRRRLAASMAQDRRLKEQFGGYNADRSDYEWGRYGWRQYNPIQFNGTIY